MATPHVALLIETSRSYGRELLQGVRQFEATHGPWSCFMELRALDSPLPPWLKSWRGDGILTRTSSAEAAKEIRKLDVPTVELRLSRQNVGFPFVGVDNEALVRKVVRYFLDNGHRNFAVYALDTEVYFAERCDRFVDAVAANGGNCHVLRQQGQSEKPKQWERQQARIVQWVRQLPKPIAIFACTDQLGYWLLDACQRAGVAVPEEAAVVGVENDESLCEMASPPLTSIPLGGKQVGYAAAEMLHRWMNGEPPAEKQLLLPPPDPVVRQSSDSVAIDDADLSKALEFIRRRATAGIGVDDILREVPVSRSSLERKMRKLIGRSPNQEINRVRLEAVKRLLAETDLTLDVIATRCGFGHVQYLSTLFKAEHDMTPGQWRTRQG
ncbi:XylR family transcriptional regulator [Rubinisphaera sp. JC750]|uniref:XylR family transcriptional regulator n=1 Tax=Rubinisphaera sp. JC750 TaxID=2898658 RepID=UPI001F1A0798|nr:DNA-binding transcriptional regulator [Rubinisphaera sp. JC750]